MKLFRFLLISFGLMPLLAHADFDWRADLLDAIKNPRGVNTRYLQGCEREAQDRINTSAPYVDADDEIIYEEIKNHCFPGKDVQFNKKASPEQYNKALARYYDYAEKYKNDAAKMISESKPGMKAEEVALIGRGLGSAAATVKAKCEMPDFKGNEMCKDSQKYEKLYNELVELDKKNSPLIGAAQAKEMKAGQIKNGKVLNTVSKTKDWDWGYDWKLTQIANGYAIYKNFEGSAEYVTAVKKTTIKKTLSRGIALSSSVDCVKYTADKTWEDDKGFPIKAKIYEAVTCPK